MRRLLVNDCLTTIPGTRTFWHDLQEWFQMEFVGGDYSTLADKASVPAVDDATLVIRNSAYFPPFESRCKQICLVQDILDGAARKIQDAVLLESHAAVFNSEFTYSKYKHKNGCVVPLPVDFALFEPGNPMGLQQMFGLPDGCVCWIGASQGAAGHVKGFDIFLRIVRLNPDIPFVAVFKDAAPELAPPNMRCYVRLPQDELARVIGACRAGLCTSRTESQHLAGIEMGACGLPMVAPPYGCYWKREDLPGILAECSVEALTNGVRAMLKAPGDPQAIREYWRKEFDRPVIKAAWEKLIGEVECSGR